MSPLSLLSHNLSREGFMVPWILPTTFLGFWSLVSPHSPWLDFSGIREHLSGGGGSHNFLYLAREGYFCLPQVNAEHLLGTAGTPTSAIRFLAPLSSQISPALLCSLKVEQQWCFLWRRHQTWRKQGWAEEKVKSCLLLWRKDSDPNNGVSEK